MRIHSVKIADRRGSISDRTLVQGTVGEDAISLDLDSEWEGFFIAVAFRWYGGSIVAKEVDGVYEVPWECLRETGKVRVVVEGTLDGKVMRHVVIDPPMVVIASESATGASPTDPTVSEYRQAYENAVKATSSAEDAAAAANTAATSANGSATKADAAAAKADAAAASADASAAKADTAATTASDSAAKAEASAAKADVATAKADTAATGAGNVNATLSGTKLTVTDRSGASTTVDTKGEKGDTGDPGPQGEPGADGYTPVRGTDYWTDQDVAEIKAYIDSQGVLPEGIGYAGVQRLVQAGAAARYFPVGSQLLTELSGNGYSVPGFAWDVVHHFDGSDDDHPLVTLESGEQVPGMMIQAHRTVPWAIVWKPKQAAIAVVGDMPAGTYCFTVKTTVKWGTGVAASVGSVTYQFTTTQALSAGAQLVWSKDGYSTDPTAMQLQAYPSSASTTVIESCDVIEGSEGTDLGTMTDATPSANATDCAKLNNIQRACYGSNRWSTSQERVALNQTGLVEQGGTEFSRPWSLVGKTGLLGCLPEEFVSVLGSVARSQELHPWDGGEVETVYDRMFPVSAREHGFANYLSETTAGYKASGVPLDYWTQLRTASGRTSWDGWKTYPELITYDSVATTSARIVWLRTADRDADSANNVGYVFASGSVDCTNASSGYFAAPACVIC